MEEKFLYRSGDGIRDGRTGNTLRGVDKNELARLCCTRCRKASKQAKDGIKIYNGAKSPGFCPGTSMARRVDMVFASSNKDEVEQIFAGKMEHWGTPKSTTDAKKASRTFDAGKLQREWLLMPKVIILGIREARYQLTVGVPKLLNDKECRVLAGSEKFSGAVRRPHLGENIPTYQPEHQALE